MVSTYVLVLIVMCNSAVEYLPYGTYRLIRALFHIRSVIIPRNRYRPKGFSPRVDIGRGMITVLIWEKAYINLFITYFNIELKRIKLTSHTDTKLVDRSDWYRLRDSSPDMETPIHLSSLDTDLFQTKIDSWAEVTSWGSRGTWYRVYICPWVTRIIQALSVSDSLRLLNDRRERNITTGLFRLAHGVISLWDFRCLRMGKIDVITYKYVIMINNRLTDWICILPHIQ